MIIPCPLLSKRRIPMRNKRADADHMRPQFLNPQHILCQRLCTLSRRSHHKSTAGLEPCLFQSTQTILSMIKRHLRRMQSAIMCPVPGFMPEQIPIRPRLIKQAVRSLFPFTDGKGERTIRPATFDQTDDLLYPRIRIPGILPSLQDKGAESQSISFHTA